MIKQRDVYDTTLLDYEKKFKALSDHKRLYILRILAKEGKTLAEEQMSLLISQILREGESPRKIMPGIFFRGETQNQNTR